MSLDLSIEWVHRDFTLKALVTVTMPALRLLCLLCLYYACYVCTMPTMSIYNYRHTIGNFKLPLTVLIFSVTIFLQKISNGGVGFLTHGECAAPPTALSPK